MKNDNLNQSADRRDFLKVSTLGTASFAAMGLIGTNSAQASVSSSTIFVTTDFGVVPDGNDNSQALADLLDWVPDGSVVLFAPGDYILTNWSVYTLDKSVTLTAYENSVTLHGPGAVDIPSNDFIRIESAAPASGNKIVIEGLTFKNWSKAIYVASNDTPIALLQIRQCQFVDMLRGIYAYGGSSSDMSGNYKIVHVSIENCRFSNIQTAAIMINSWFDSALISSNRIDNILNGSAIILGNTNHGFGSKDDYFLKATITNNWCTNIFSQNPDGDTHGIIFGGKEAIITHNHIENVSNGGGIGAEGIYLKARYSIICHNSLIDAALKEAAITLKGSERSEVGGTSARGYANLISNNSIVYTQDQEFRRAIMCFTSDVLISDNYIENVDSGIRCIGDENNITVKGNLLRDVTSAGIVLGSSANNVTISDNTIQIKLTTSSSRTGILLGVQDGANDWLICNNHIDGVDKTYVSYAIKLSGLGNEISGLHIATNQFSNLQRAIYAKPTELPVITSNGAWIHGNYFRNMTYYVSSTIAGQAGSVRIEDNFEA